VLEKECCLPGVFCDSGDTPTNLLVSSMAISCHVPAVSMANGEKMCVLAKLEYVSILFCAVLWAAAPGLVAVLPMWDSAYVSGTVTS